MFADWFNLIWKRDPNVIAAELEKAEPEQERIARASETMRRELLVFEDLLDGRDYLLGEFGVADCLAFPFLKYPVLGLPPGDDELFHRVLVEHQPLDDGYPRLRDWVERVDRHPRG